MEERARALDQIAALARQHGLSADDIAAALGQPRSDESRHARQKRARARAGRARRHLRLCRRRRVHRAAVERHELGGARGRDAGVGPHRVRACGALASRPALRRGDGAAAAGGGGARTDGHARRVRRVRHGRRLALGQPGHDRHHGPAVYRRVPWNAPIDAAVPRHPVRRALLVDGARPARRRRQRSIALVLGGSLLLTAVGTDRAGHRDITPVWYFTGAGGFLYGVFDAVERTPFEIGFLAVAAAFVYLSAVLHSRTLLAVSTLAHPRLHGLVHQRALRRLHRLAAGADRVRDRDDGAERAGGADRPRLRADKSDTGAWQARARRL